MPVTEHPMQALSNFLPKGSFEPVVAYIHHYKVHLTVTRKRKTVLGNYLHAGINRNHTITINGNLNKYEFLITLLHELAHLLTFEQFKNQVEPHGKEWKLLYSKLLIDFVQRKIFPEDVEQALQKSIINPAATANGETDLLLVLRKYNTQQKKGISTIEALPLNAIFQTENGKIFQKGNQRRKRYECVEIKTGLKYLFSPIAEVKLVE
ncbi:MAG: SprT-like domain-containing protein [Chitinophagaceae bacterium]|jgi:hypothetical protein|nr:SprT-like domain-containing protein [Chitinophagaceae bacterium]